MTLYELTFERSDQHGTARYCFTDKARVMESFKYWSEVAADPNHWQTNGKYTVSNVTWGIDPDSPTAERVAEILTD